MATYYKVVRKNRKGEYRSAIINGKACLRYALGGRTEGFEGMPVFLFRHESAAQEFAPRGSTVLAGTAGNPRHQAFRGSCTQGLQGLRAFWRRGPSTDFWNRWATPPDTYAADWFEPERVVA